jgi:hypothetical protein
MKYTLKYAGQRLEAIDTIIASGARLERDSTVSFQSTRQLEYCLSNGIGFSLNYTASYPLTSLVWKGKNKKWKRGIEEW